MNCFEFEESVRALARNQLMDATTYERGMSHAANCAQCAGRLAAERTLFAGIAGVISEVAREEAPARVEAIVIAAFREEVRAANPNALVGGSPMAVKWSAGRLVAAAACIMIAGSLLVMVWLQAGSSRSNTQEVSATGSTISRPENVPLPAPPEADRAPGENDLVRVSPRKTRTAATRVKPKPAEIVTEFYPIVEGGDLDLVEGVQILRVELPASALADAGLATGPDGSNGSVKADVVLGHDGMARAIRFVR